MKHLNLDEALSLAGDPAALYEYQFTRLRRQLAYCYQRSSLYREKFQRAGVRPADVDSWEKFRSLQVFLNKEDERISQERSLSEEGHPYGIHLCARPERLLGISATSGSTGEPTFSYVNTERDIRLNRLVWGRMLAWLGIRKGEVVLHALGLSMWALGAPGVMAMIQNGVRPVPIGAEAGVERILRMAALTRPVLLLATPSLTEHLIQRAPEVLGAGVGALGIRKILCVGEPGAGQADFRRRVGEAFGAEVHDGRGLAWGVLMISCSQSEYQGMHDLTPDITIASTDIVDVHTHHAIPLQHGVTGKLLVTHLERQARPSIRFDMGDVHEVLTERCPCGRPGNRVKVLGRADDMLIVKGVNVYPAAVKNILQSFIPRVSGQMRIVISGSSHRISGPLSVKVESTSNLSDADRDILRKEIEQQIHARLRCRSEVMIVPEGSLKRGVVKTPLVERRNEVEKS